MDLERQPYTNLQLSIGSIKTMGYEINIDILTLSDRQVELIQEEAYQFIENIKNIR